jgi:predicted DNA repair protein MutK
MASGLLALLDDVAAIAKLAAASVDDIAAASGRASAKAAGVVIDDAAVTPRYVIGLSPERELPMIGRIARGSLRNKLLILMPVFLALAAFAPWALTPLLMAGGAYLAFEAAEKLLEKAGVHRPHGESLPVLLAPEARESAMVKGAIRTDLILSAEILAISLGQLGALSLAEKAAALAIVSIVVTAAVYGAVALIVKMDDVGLRLAATSNGLAQRVGRGLVAGMPGLLAALSALGVFAMAWVGGGILLHGMEELGVLTGIPHAAHALAHAAGAAMPFAGEATEWLVSALLSALFGMIVGALIAALVALWHRTGWKSPAH